MDTLALAAANLTSPPVLAFLLGLLATAVGGDLRLPEPVYQLLSVYLLLGIGIKGGVALSEAPAGEVIAPVLVTFVLGSVHAFSVFLVVRVFAKLQERRARGEVPEDEVPAPSDEAVLLGEIRDLLRAQAGTR